MHVKKGDIVKIIAGKERKLPPAEVLAVFPNENKVIVAGRNLVVRHVRGNSLLGTESHKEEVEAKIHASNVQLWSEKLEKPVRTQMRYVGKNQELFTSLKDAASSLGEGSKVRKVRFCPKSEETFDTLD